MEDLVIAGVKLGTAIIEAIIVEARRPGATRETVFHAAQSVIDRARAIDADVDAVASGKR